jgi:hypothetical protein
MEHGPNCERFLVLKHCNGLGETIVGKPYHCRTMAV